MGLCEKLRPREHKSCIPLRHDPDMTPSRQLPDFAAAWMKQRSIASERLAAMKQHQLRAMTEADSARVFSQLEPLRPFALRPTSGLVEQQRLFQKLLRKTPDTEEGGSM
jgi:hypothetical protein